MPKSRTQTGLRTPLNEILGAGTHVRLLRVLSLAGTSLTASELARRAGLGRTGVYPALEALEQTGIVELVGIGVQRQVAFRREHPLAEAIAALFRAEAQRIDALVAALRHLVAQLRPAPMSAWIDDPSELGGASEPDFVNCYVVGDPKALPHMVDEINANLLEIERDFQVHIDVLGLSRSELTTRVRVPALGKAVLLGGVPPTALLDDGMDARQARMQRNLRVHSSHDEKSRLLALAIAEKLKRDPSVARAAVRQARLRMEKASAQERRELQEWVRLLRSMPRARLYRFLTHPGERATRLRQSLPALGLLTPEERQAVLASRTEDEVKAAIARMS